MTQRQQQIEVETDIPIPGFGARTKTSLARNPVFDGMKVGDSFFIIKWNKSFLSSVHYARLVAESRTGFKFTTRALTENGVEGVRVWRVS